jgi:hypothetical protein
MKRRSAPPTQTRPCPSCGRRTFYVIESRRRKEDAIRRFRRRCSSCEFGETTYEITGKQMKEYDMLLRLNTAIQQVLNPPTSESRKSCTLCSYWSNGSCSMQFPEAGGLFASECSLYEPNQHEDLPLVREGHTQSGYLRRLLPQNARR